MQVYASETRLAKATAELLQRPTRCGAGCALLLKAT